MLSQDCKQEDTYVVAFINSFWDNFVINFNSETLLLVCSRTGISLFQVNSIKLMFTSLVFTDPQQY
ncbi:CLUMA_CG015555, isoform A [Clunio marinus]|uniref:CLUMA_CG015555, isoform A n=1 Tax=Clunio marinus TaxID=568069 RepID=A0A1J1IP18_9DIPT|nr:CLUMA_CG015555, isoform A [Clunio marinus]